jgi:hypothetical protein
LQQLYEHTNPFQLRKAIYRQLEALWEMATACRAVQREEPLLGKLNQTRKEVVGFSNIFI